MSVPYKPETYTSAAPYLVVDGAARTIDFLERVFGAERLRRYDLPNGKVLHAEVRLDDTVIMLADPPRTGSRPRLRARLRAGRRRDLSSCARRGRHRGAGAGQEGRR
jgi:hypothetical protein